MATFFFPTSRPRPRKVATIFINISSLFLLLFFLKAYLCPSNSNHALNQHFHGPAATIFNRVPTLHDLQTDECADLHELSDHISKCSYVKTNLNCFSRGYINYLQIFYCNLGGFPVLGFALLALWLVVLFYLLGDTASNYFCHSLEGLSNILRLSPTIAGVTLLSLGNGAPDFFASVVSFTRSNGGAVGLNSILGGALFVSCTVLGIISILVSPKEITVDKVSFIRDVGFLLFSLFSLSVIIYVGRINLWGSICYISTYFLYVCAVSVPHFINKREKKEETALFSDELALAESAVPMLCSMNSEKEKTEVAEKASAAEDETQDPQSLGNASLNCNYLSKFLKALELPLSLPRRLTIPIVSEEKWSKPFAVMSVALAPLVFAAVCDTQLEYASKKSNLIKYLPAAIAGFILGCTTCVKTKSSSPPRKCLFPWLAGGFAMSIIWTYIIAEELVSLLYSLGNIIGVSPCILGLTVLAWGNSLGDLIANGAMALNGGEDGVQIAISGCYAGPMFNTLIGLGLPLVLSAWSEYPSSYVIPEDHSLYETLLFLTAGLLWALVILLNKNMRLDKALGAGLLAIYLCFLFIRIATAIVVIKL
ncbi:cation/calcium exchanger 1-like [Prosopis cineraria]|uniref:cation/calcium exchanger 1-like n=1 Tax=Prosopis cineraria TaxID=364024 RepID=UPI00240F45C1|nr:cation/calcium exchanger 1-like [Prosopis cineraria]